MIEFDKFRQKTIKEIRIWAWLAAVLPITALAGTVFIWVFGTSSALRTALIIGETTMFAIAVVWWWWAIYVIRRLVDQWTLTSTNIMEILNDIIIIKNIVNDSKTDPADK